MNIQELEGDEHAIETEADAAPLRADARDIHDTPTFLPPPDESPESEPPPTARWTPPPALIAYSRFEERADTTL